MRLTKLLTLRRGKSLYLPAHGRGKALPMEIKELLGKKPGVWDLPELPDIGAPTLPIGAIAESQDKAALSIGAKKGWYGVNGATGLLQASLFSIAKPNESVLMPRNVHRSIIQACILGDIRPVLFDLPFLEDRGHYSVPDESLLKNVIEKIEKDNIKISAAVLTNPTYQGYSSNLKPLINLFHKKDWPVLVDEAHGAYFSASQHESLPQSALKVGADLVVHSLHKSSSGLVQTAVLWMQGDLVDPLLVERSIQLFQTTSPSALLLASCETAINQWFVPGEQKKLDKIINNANNIAFNLRKAGVPILFNQDPLRLVLHTASIGICGLKADSWFIDKGIIPELPEQGTITFCLGFSKQKGLISSMKKSWKELLSSKLEKNSFPPFTRPPFPLVTYLERSCMSAYRAESEILPLKECVGRISSELISPYPPGIPFLLPGEIIDQRRVEWIRQQSILWPNQIPSKIKVVS